MALFEDSFDPLRVEEHDPYWKEVEPYFRPFHKTDVAFLKSLKTCGGNDPYLELPPVGGYQHPDRNSEQGLAERKQATLNSFPFTQRVVAALIDTGDGDSIASTTTKIKGSSQEEPLWKGFSDRDTQRYYQEVFEERIKEQLQKLGLLQPEDDDYVQSRIRDLQWRLRTAKHDARIRRTNLLNKVSTTETKRQASAREIKAHNDDLEILYLVHMFRKYRKNKKYKTRFQKLLNSMFPACRGWKEADIENFRGKKLTARATSKKSAYASKTHAPKEAIDLPSMSEGLNSAESMSDVRSVSYPTQKQSEATKSQRKATKNNQVGSS
ncbi:hypothetical protein Gasu2_13870 [Galdieria sulphuraria]|uniref:Uncharacterized protein n=1 Tax=Galdieria sulphuraria TaxID=130081 RepID=M2XTH7_GALSU|nr:uncharacterized protein Gasu_56280 [Galdieria sulphuraria]EME26729.1 hypothetical protein Gasu_56280 [Galdieria sulphuraria]GJD07003.1 hypothetical protein Gasu2_13870 [Galdieria sulphuraria]|eukprot:XP_005703249.1 hypothetical protein Gasu_56280 [Galdieria sulphuraria]